MFGMYIKINIFGISHPRANVNTHCIKIMVNWICKRNEGKNKISCYQHIYRRIITMYE